MSNNLKTTNERIEGLEEKMDKILSIINPETAIDDANKPISDKIDNFLKEVRGYIDRLKPQSEKEVELDDEDTPKFERNMWTYAVTGFSASAFATVITYNFIMFFFPLAFSLFFSFGLIVLGLLNDKYLLPGNTLRRIARNAISASIFWLAFTLSSVAGFFFGTSIISDPFRGEERSNKQEQVRYIDTPTPSVDSDTIRVGEGNATED